MATKATIQLCFFLCLPRLSATPTADFMQAHVQSYHTVGLLPCGICALESSNHHAHMHVHVHDFVYKIAVRVA